ncbi:MAG: oxidoreductase [Chloroflexi bacterium]|nr:oxidoreductase [Chloroflexota bacterium]
MQHGQVGAHPRVGVVKFASCDGCQLTILNLEDELLSVVEHFDIIDFPEATSARSAGPYDVLFVEGSVSEPAHLERIVELRKRCRTLVTIGACATAGGIQALRNWGDHDAFRASVYAHPEYIHTLAKSTPIADHVQVDAELRGCPIDPGQLVELLTALVTGRRPQLIDEAVCMECKRRGVVCVMVGKGIPCLGQVTQTGCGAICPRFGRGCYGCFGPREQANAAGLARYFEAVGDRTTEDVGRLFAGFTAYSEPFRSMVSDLGGTRWARGEGAVEAAPAGGGDARN